VSVIPISITPANDAPTDVAAYLRPGTLSLPALPPLSLYVHFPWCVRKCPYCDFNSHEPEGGTDRIPEAEYLKALRADIEAALPLIWGRRIVSIFIGGGTPSLLSARGLDTLLSDARALLALEADCEITLEANPGTVEAGRFADYRRAGVNRLSIGVQSFDDARLQALGRIHDRGQALRAIDAARQVFDNFNIDLMYGLPGQDLAAAQEDVEQALALAPPHLSLYQLTLEPNTVFAKHPPPLPDEDTVASMQAWIEVRTADAGYRHYEVSAYAQPGRECRHNLNYWGFGDYLGVGPGAHSKISFPHRIIRQVRYRGPRSYLERAERGEFLAESTEIGRDDLPFEFMLNAMRLLGGVPSHWFTERTGLPPTAIDKALVEAERRGLVATDHAHWAPTALGARFLSDLQALFLPSRRNNPK
jgi:putative oxygen-independent coproporphyrinogen III oxidase